MRGSALVLLWVAVAALGCALCAADEDVLGEVIRDIEAEQREMQEAAEVESVRSC